MLYIAAIMLSFFLSVVLVTKRKKSTGDYILFAWLVTIGLHLLFFYLFRTEQYTTRPWLIVPGFVLPLAHSPFLYLYTIHQLSAKRFKPAELLHFLPLLLSALLFTRFYLMSPAEQLSVIQRKGQGFETESSINVAAIYLSGLVYIPLSLMKLLRYKQRIVDRFSNTEKINFNWLVYLVAWLVAIWLVVIFGGNEEWTFSLVAVFITWLGYFGIKQVQVFSEVRTEVSSGIPQAVEPVTEVSEANDLSQPDVRYQKSTLSDPAADKIHQRLLELLKAEQPYKDPDLTLSELAGRLNVHPNVLSQVINSRERKTFYDLVNEKRVREFIRLSAEPQSQQFTILSLAFDCGFNSKASFNRNFKKHTGQTPSEFMKQFQAAEQGIISH